MTNNDQRATLPVPFKNFSVIVIEGKQYITIKQLSKLIDKSINSCQQLTNRGKFSIYGDIPLEMFPDIFNIALIPYEVLFKFPLIREKGNPCIIDNKVKAKCFDLKGNIVTKWFPINVPMKFIPLEDRIASDDDLLEGEEV